jgi:hypothetical protein
VERGSLVSLFGFENQGLFQRWVTSRSTFCAEYIASTIPDVA